MSRRALGLAAAGAVLAAGAAVALLADGSAERASSASDRAAATGDASPSAAAQEADTLPTQAIPPTASRDTLSEAQKAILDHYETNRGPRQPIPFSHEFHVSQLQIECEYCHTGTGRGEVAPMPAVETCMGCHRTVGRDLVPINRLAAYWDRGEPVPWVRVYKLPEFVQFPHRPHVQGGVECQECHGPVERMPRVYQATPLTMGWCLECHRQDPSARETPDWHTTAELAEAFPAPEIPTGRQSAGLYPIRIDQKYANTLAPMDCAACHY